MTRFHRRPVTDEEFAEFPDRIRAHFDRVRVLVDEHTGDEE